MNLLNKEKRHFLADKLKATTQGMKMFRRSVQRHQEMQHPSNVQKRPDLTNQSPNLMQMQAVKAR